MDEELNKEPEPALEPDNGAAPPEEEAAPPVNEPRYVTEDMLEDFAARIVNSIQPQRQQRQEPEEDDVPDPLDNPREYARYIANLSAGEVQKTIQQQVQANQAQQNAINALGGNENIQALFDLGYTADQILHMAGNPKRAEAARKMVAPDPQQPKPRAVRSEGSYVADDTQISSATQREIAAAASHWEGHDWFDAKEFNKMMRNKAGSN